MLAAALENTLGLDACKADTDGDGVPDGYEYQSARDLNDDEYQEPNKYLPYPGKRPYPNPLDQGRRRRPRRRLPPLLRGVPPLGPLRRPPAGLAADDYSLYYSAGEQYSLSRRERHGRRTSRARLRRRLRQAGRSSWTRTATATTATGVLVFTTAPWYETATTPSPVLRHPRRQPQRPRAGRARRSTTTTPTAPAPSTPTARSPTTSATRTPTASRNNDEPHGRRTAGYWAACYADEKPYTTTYAGTDLVDPDSDGDGILDGADDQDHDDIPNMMELSRNTASGTGRLGPRRPVQDQRRDPDHRAGRSRPGRQPGSARGLAPRRLRPGEPVQPVPPVRRGRAPAPAAPESARSSAPFDESTDWFSLK